MLYSPLSLKKNEEKRLLQGHLWVYSNEVSTQQTPFSGFTPGDLVSIIDHRGQCLGNGYVNPNTLLCARLLSRNPSQSIDLQFFVERIRSALVLRQTWFKNPFYRLIYGESDGLPGVIVDRYGEFLVVQVNTAGMEKLKPILLNALQEILAPAGILWRNDSNGRTLEGLSSYVEVGYGEVPAEITLEESGAHFLISPYTGQKTGWFYDHRDNRQQLQHFVSGKRVLDVFSYVGAWSIQAAQYGAKEIWALDSSAKALELLLRNAQLNKVDSQIQTYEADAFQQLKQWTQMKMQFDVIILDPPAFIKKRKDHAEGLTAYKRLNLLALQLLATEGYLITASCSHHLSEAEFHDSVLWAGLKSHRHLQILKRGHQGVDHPILPAIPEMSYLKSLICRVADQG